MIVSKVNIDVHLQISAFIFARLAIDLRCALHPRSVRRECTYVAIKRTSLDDILELWDRRIERDLREGGFRSYFSEGWNILLLASWFIQSCIFHTSQQRHCLNVVFSMVSRFFMQSDITEKQC